MIENASQLPLFSPFLSINISDQTRFTQTRSGKSSRFKHTKYEEIGSSWGKWYELNGFDTGERFSGGPIEEVERCKAPCGKSSN